MKMVVGYLHHELADRGVQRVHGKSGEGMESSLKTSLIMLAAGTECNETPVELSSRRERSGGRGSTEAGIGNVENLDEVVSCRRACA
jgi:hypothetical protein